MRVRLPGLLLRLILVLVGVALLLAGYVMTQMPKTGALRIEAGNGVVGVFTEASYAWVVRTEHGVLLIDTGMEPEGKAVIAELKAQGLGPEAVHTILLTHGHLDHWGAASRFTAAKVHVMPGDLPLVRRTGHSKGLLPSIFEKIGEPGPTPQNPAELSEGTLEVDGAQVRVIAVPGHTAGSAMFLTHGLLFTGDSLFAHGDAVKAPPGFINDDTAQNRQSLRKLLAVDFTRIADGHSGLGEDARQKLARLLGE